MPSSYPENIPAIIQAIAKLKPKSVLDIGIGRGKYGFLIREYFPPTKEKEKIYDDSASPIKSMGCEEILTVDGVEVFEPYITDLQKKIYNQIFIGNVLEMDIEKWEPHDLYLLIDVIEHWERKKTMELIEKLIKKGNILISTPRSYTPQRASYGNKWEEHLTEYEGHPWTADDFNMYPLEDISNNISLMLILLKQ